MNEPNLIIDLKESLERQFHGLRVRVRVCNALWKKICQIAALERARHA
jgi:hypothetical protein